MANRDSILIQYRELHADMQCFPPNSPMRLRIKKQLEELAERVGGITHVGPMRKKGNNARHLRR